MLPPDCRCDDDILLRVSPDPAADGAAPGEVLGGATSAVKVDNDIEDVADEAEEVGDTPIEAEPDGVDVVADNGPPRPREVGLDPDAAVVVEVLKARGGTEADRVDTVKGIADVTMVVWAEYKGW